MNTLQRLYHTLPIQLLLLTFKRKRLILALWVLLFLIITGNFARTYGVPYLLLDPEYMDHVGFRSLFILGFAFGIFIMAFNITIYILESYRFQFLMIQENPFAKFCLNNIFFPLLFIMVYSVMFYQFQIEQGRQEVLTIIKELAGFYLGIVVTVALVMLYFKLTGYRVFRFLTLSLNNTLKQQKISRVGVIQKIRMVKKKSYHVDYYLDFPLKVKKVDSFMPFDKTLITKVIDQNHMNAVLLQVAGFIMILILGYFRDNPYFQIPAGASILILVSIITMFIGFFSFWMKGWWTYALIAVLLAVNYAIQFKWINPDYQVFGLNYNTTKAVYNYERLVALSSPKNYINDHQNMIVTLEKWRQKFPPHIKPKIIITCASGGGQRASVWTMRTLQVADSILGGKLFDHTFAITGASGGLVGASYYRELFLRKKLYNNVEPTRMEYLQNMSKDILNPIVFSLIVNDIFVRFETFNDGKYTYIKDRGYAFEKQLNTNTGGILNKKVMEYAPYEANAEIPLLFLTPSIVNDGRKLYISPMPLSFMNGNDTIDLWQSKIKGVEFMRFFKDQDAENLGFLSALRMSATFPYITPNINLPSQPSMEIMDAGLTDNFGVIDAVRFTYVFRDWISKNTSGVVFMCIRDSPKLIPIEKQKTYSLLDRVINPIGTLYSNWDWIQDNNDEYYLEYAKSFLTCGMDVIEFQYSPLPDGFEYDSISQTDIDQFVAKTWTQRASLNWHLTKKEKESLKKTIYTPQNQASLVNLQRILQE